jgi:uncharacterized membrane protein
MTTNVASSMGVAPRRHLSPRARKAILTVHIVVSVALLGDCLGLLAIALRASTIDDPALAAESYRTMEMFSTYFGIPLSVATLITGIVLGVGSRWGVFRSGWVAAKLGLIISVMAVGALVIGIGEEQRLTGAGGAEPRLIVGAAYPAAARAAATALSVYKPRRRIRPDGIRRSTTTGP